MHNCGVYSIVSPSGNFYIGSSENIQQRWKTHTILLKKGKHHSIALQNAWNKHQGELNFNILLICRPDDLLLYEQQYLDFYKPRYNISLVAGSPMKGRNHSDDTRNKMSISHTGKILKEETKQKLSEDRKGKSRPAHVVEILADYNTSRKGKKFPGTGRKWTQEEKEALAIKMTGRVLSEETKRKMSMAAKGNKQALGMIHSEETKKRIGQASKLAWDKKKVLQ